MLSSWVVTINIPYYRLKSPVIPLLISRWIIRFLGVYIVTVVGHPAFSLMTLLSQKYTY
jgi:hypothetical protein